MFAEFVPSARERGWQSLIPIRPGQKRPAILKWSAFNKRPPTEVEFTKWSHVYRNCGVGLAFGPDDVIGVDLDWTEPAIAVRAWDITTTILGETPLVRIGRPPKKLALYRRESGLVVGKAYGCFELFTKSGQCVLYGVHPDTGQPYRWLSDTPATLGPADLPLATRKQIFALIDELEQLDAVATARHRARVYGQTKPGITTDILRALQDVEDAPAEVARILAAAPQGKRHDTMVGAALALAMRGSSDAAIFAALDDAYYLVNDLSIEDAIAEVKSAIRWARECVGPDDAAITDVMAALLQNITAAWDRSWRRS